MFHVVAILVAASSLLTQEWECGPVSAVLKVSSSEIPVAGVIYLKIISTVPATSLEETLQTGRDRRYQLESLNAQLSRIDGLRLLSEDADEEIEGGSVRSSWLFKFEPRRTGPVEIPALNLVFDGDSPITIRSTAIPINVRSLVDGDPLKAVPRPAASLPEPRESGILGWLLAMLIVAASWFLLKRGAAQKDLPAPRLSPREEALANLEGSEEPARWLEILRTYLASGDESRITPRDRALLLDLFRDLDAIQFAPEESSKPTQVRERLQNFIRTTEL